MVSRIWFVFIIVFSLSFLCGFLMGGFEKIVMVKFYKGSEFGFEKDLNVYVYLVIFLWNWLFKFGYCVSWEWYIDKKYREKRVVICK